MRMTEVQAPFGEMITDRVVTSQFNNVSLSLTRVTSTLSPPQGWVLTLINNGGVSKQQNASEVVDASAGRAVTVTLKPREGSAASAWVSTGVRTGNGTVDTRPLPVQSGQQVTVVVPAGQLCVVGLVLLT